MNTHSDRVIRRLRRGVGPRRQSRHNEERAFGEMKVSRGDARVALSHQTALEKKVSELVAAAANSTGEIANLRETLSEIQTAVQGLGQHFFNSLDGSFFAEREPSALAEKVFGTPEILENILLRLQPWEILRAMRVGKSWHANIEHSVKLQRRLSLRVDTIPGRLCIPFQSMVLPGLAFETELIMPAPGLSGYRVLLNICSTTNVTMGDRIRQMHISNSYLAKVHLQPACCGGSTVRPQCIDNATGVRLGELMDACRELRKQHWECFKAAPHCQRANGKVNMTINCWTGTTVTYNDPMAIEGRAWDSAEQAARARDQVMAQYSWLKRNIHGRAPLCPIPTMLQARAYNFDPVAWIANNP
ncbi:unnamed protein product [Zymoseptoria tritici ST99CH_1A5]|uniref:F-box domain-containing protein n=1 Tax=Zymoseptoria tritici ST99CH_1A5 TaxID=1276529 RepID=A0A1Y6L7R9_ZYMTR|nr:unnamed protein product [Zymoseptoria tritici ST99CH_1A5]